MSEPLRIAAIQMISGPQVAPNLQTAATLIAEAAAAGAQLVALPEYFPLIGANDAERLAAREREGSGPIQEFLAAAARRHGLWLVGGSIPLFSANSAKLLNTCLVFDPTGRQAARYDKIHLFGFNKGAESYDEAATIEAGRDPVAFDVALPETRRDAALPAALPTKERAALRVGLAICYDLRFPELFRALGETDLIVIPAAFTETTGRAHWELLLRARAVENQCYVLAAAQGGTHPTGRVTHGNSMIIDPWGEIVGRLDKGAGIVVAELDPARIAEVRTSLPALKHRKLR